MTRRLAAALAFCVAAVTSNAGPICTPAGNPIVAENEKTAGVAGRDVWDLRPGGECSNGTVNTPDCNGDPDVQGFTTDISYDRGQTVTFKIRVRTAPFDYTLDIYRMGYYGGNGARRVATLQGTATSQPACNFTEATGLVDCGNWNPTISWDGKENGVAVTSGIYFAKLRSGGRASHIVFIIRDDAGCSDILFQTSDTTWQSYNIFGDGRVTSLYANSESASLVPALAPYPTDSEAPTAQPRDRPRAYAVSYNRPFNVRGTNPNSKHSWVFEAEYPMVRWLEANGYNVSYSTGVDTDRRGDELLEHAVFMAVGHDEYWSQQQRQKVEAARDAGIHLAIFAGNEVYWKIRWEGDHRTMVCYKETQSFQNVARAPGVIASAAPSYPPAESYPASAANDGSRKAEPYYQQKMWASESTSGDRWLAIAFPSAQTIQQIDVVTQQDDYATPIEPTPTTTFQLYGLTRYDVQYQVGPNDWRTVVGGSVRHNNLVWRRFVFPPLTTEKVRVVAHKGGDGYARIIELEAYGGRKIDPDPSWTGTWRDPRFSPPSDGGRPENGLLGNIFLVNNISTWSEVKVSEEDGKLRFWRGTAAAALEPGTVLALVKGSLGFEYDTDIDNAARPEGTFRVSTAGSAHGLLLQDHGATYLPGGLPHHSTLYRDGDALVFSAGTIHWSWGLDCNHDWGDLCASHDAEQAERDRFTVMRQATVNILADMDVNPAALPGLLPSGDQTPPLAPDMTAPPSSVQQGTYVTLSGTAIDSGGKVGGVEVTFDNGTRWHPAEGRAAWTYRWVPTTPGTFTIKARATDDSGNRGTPSAGATVTVTAAPTSGPYQANTVSGQTTIQAENFDHGTDGVAFNDTTSGNAGEQYRPTNVDVAACTDSSCSGYLIAYIKPDEWLKYTIDVVHPDPYTIDVYGAWGNPARTFHVEIGDDTCLGPSQSLSTGAIYTAHTFSGFELSGGQHALRLVMDGATPPVGSHDYVGNIDRLVIRPVTQQRPYNGTAFAVPGTFQAEQFDIGSKGVSYDDTTAGNSGTATTYRYSSVDLTTCPSGAQCQTLVSYVKAGEWLEYSIDVAASGRYQIDVIGTNGDENGAFHIEIDGVSVTGPMAIARTNDNWIAGTSTAYACLTAGSHVMRVVMDTNANHGWIGNFDSFSITAATGSCP